MGMLNCFDLTGKVAVVTGASKGLGKVFAGALAKAGADLFLIARNEGLLLAATEELRGHGTRCEYFCADVTDQAQMETARERCVKIFGHVDILINNAATSRINLPPEETDLATWKQVIDTNLNGVFLCAQVFGRQMIAQGGGKIVNLASMSGLIINKGVYGGSYETSKFGVIGLTKALAVEWAKHNVQVNALAPGYFMTDPNRAFFADDPALFTEFCDATPMHRIGEPSELEGTIVYLASDATSFMTGSVVVVDGGYTCW